MSMSIPGTTPVGIPQVTAEETKGLVSPESILAYCSSRLNALDAMIQTRFADQQKRNETVKGYNTVMEIENKFPYGPLRADTDKVQFYKDCATHLATVYNETSDPELRARIESDYAMITGHQIKEIVDSSTGKAKLDAVTVDISKVAEPGKENWAKHTGEIKSKQDELSKDNELSMIQMQHVITQRSLAIQLATQLMAGANEGQKKIIENTR